MFDRLAEAVVDPPAAVTDAAIMLRRFIPDARAVVEVLAGRAALHTALPAIR